VTLQNFLEQAERWFSVTPLRGVKFTHGSELEWSESSSMPDLDSLFESPFLPKLNLIDLEECDLSPNHMVRFAQCGDLPRLKELVLARNAIGNRGAEKIAGMRQLCGLESLDLVSNNISDPGARAIAQSPYLGGLKELRISRNSIKKKSWTMLELRFGVALM
jgi:Leucine-rich repeat (LRR) protein